MAPLMYAVNLCVFCVHSATTVRNTAAQKVPKCYIDPNINHDPNPKPYFSCYPAVEANTVQKVPKVVKLVVYNGTSALLIMGSTFFAFFVNNRRSVAGYDVLTTGEDHR